MLFIEITFIIFWGACLLVPLFTRDAEVQDHLHSIADVCAGNDQHGDN